MRRPIRLLLAAASLPLVVVVPTAQQASPAAAVRSAPVTAVGSGPSPGDPLTVLDAVKFDRSAFEGIDLVSPSEQFGFSVAPLGDLNGDGHEDVAVGVPFSGGFNDGRVWVLFLDANGWLLDAVSHVSSFSSGGRFGYAVANVGDVDGNGTNDLAVTEPGIGGGATGGGLWILRLGPDGGVLDEQLTVAASFPGAVGPLEGWTESVAALGDLDGDGVGDLALGSPYGDFGSNNYGHVWISFMNANGTVREAVKVGFGLGGLTAPLTPSGGFGRALAGIGDLDGDGVEDLAVGAPGRSNQFPADQVWVLFLNADGTVRDHQEIAPGVGGFTGTVAPLGLFGFTLAAYENADGSRGLVVGAPGVSPGTSTTPGRIWLLDLASDGTVTSQAQVGGGVGGLEGPIAAFHQFGASAAVLRGLGDDGSLRLAIGATGDDQGGSNSGAVWTLDLDQKDQVVAEHKISDGSAGPLIDGELGASLARLPDLDGDGIPELAMGAPRDQGAGSPLNGTGAVWIVFPTAEGTVRRFTKIAAGTGGLQAKWGFTASFGRGLASLGDLDGDGVGDLAVGLPHSGFTQSGRVVVLFLNPDGTVKAEQEIGAGLGGFTGPLEDRDRFGWSVACLGDVNGDGTVDLAVGAPGAEPFSVGGQVEGAAWILFLQPDGTVLDERRLSAGLNGLPRSIAPDSEFGYRVASLGDFDGDGTPDLVAGAPLVDDGRGSVWLMTLEPDGSVASASSISQGVAGFVGPLVENAWFGRGVASIGDVDGNGVRDLAVGAPRTDFDPSGFQDIQGALWLLLLDELGTVVGEVSIDQQSTPFLGLAHPDFFGESVENVGDWNGDGVADLLVGGPFEGVSFSAQVGAAWLLSLGGVAQLDFETSGDLVTPLGNGAEVSVDAGFAASVEVDGLSFSGLTTAVFDSTPDGPNAGSSDPDLLVDRGNVVILQETAGQSTPGIYDSPDDDRFGGHVEVSFAGREVEPLRVTLVDQCPGSGPPTQVTLIDSAGRERTFVVPTGWTEDVSVHGAPGYRVLDLTSLEDQPGFLSTAFVIDDPFFDATAVTRLEIDFHGSGAFDDLVYDPYP